MQEEIEQKSVNLAVRTGKVTAQVLYRALSNYLREQKNKKNMKQAGKEKTPKGKMSVKQLIGKGDGVTSIEIGDIGIRDFKRTANKYGVDFAVVKEKTGEQPKYIVFFKAKEVDAINHVVTELGSRLESKKKEKETERPSIRKRLNELKKHIAALPRKEKRKELER
ncbi:MAG: PcfB family protein [Lachnospiraceae bacterium]|nr:PcfB family protein [Lachnospiraceae bacterium]